MPGSGLAPQGVPRVAASSGHLGLGQKPSCLSKSGTSFPVPLGKLHPPRLTLPSQSPEDSVTSQFTHSWSVGKPNPRSAQPLSHASNLVPTSSLPLLSQAHSLTLGLYPWTLSLPLPKPGCSEDIIMMATPPSHVFSRVASGPWGLTPEGTSGCVSQHPTAGDPALVLPTR